MESLSNIAGCDIGLRSDEATERPTILGEIPPNAFFLIDPKGWRVPLKTLTPLLASPNSEVIFNFMFDFINRAASINEPKVVAGLDELILLGSWRAVLAEEERSGGLSTEERNEILVNASRQDHCPISPTHS